MSEGRIPAGFYKGRAVAGSEQYASKNGTDQIAIDLDVPSIGRQLTTFLYFTDNAAQYAIERLRACGWSGDDLTNLAGVDTNEVDVQIKYEMYDGKEKMKVEIATGGGRFKFDNPMDEKQKRAFAARIKMLLKGNGAGAAKPAAPQSRRNEGAYDPGPPDTNDDIPF